MRRKYYHVKSPMFPYWMYNIMIDLEHIPTQKCHSIRKRNWMWPTWGEFHFVNSNQINPFQFHFLPTTFYHEYHRCQLLLITSKTCGYFSIWRSYGHLIKWLRHWKRNTGTICYQIAERCCVFWIVLEFLISKGNTRKQSIDEDSWLCRNFKQFALAQQKLAIIRVGVMCWVSTQEYW